MKCAKAFLFLLNIVDLLVGLTLVGLGILAHFALSHFQSSIGEINTISIILIVVGSFVVLVSFLGCCGAVRQSRCLLILFCIFTVLILLVQVAVICLAFLARNQVNVVVGDVLFREVNDYNVSTPSAIPNQIWDWIQTEFQCCGVNNYTDWKLNSDFKTLKSIPVSCCVDPQVDCGDNMLQLNPQPDKINIDGCVDGLEQYMKENLVAFGAIVIIAAILLIIKFSLAVFILNCIQRSSGSGSLAKKNVGVYASTMRGNEKSQSFTYSRFS